MAVSRRPPGELAIVLHTHMPYVEGFGTWPFGEEWLWEAMIGSYLPLLDLLDAGAPLTLSLTPVLCDQLQAPGVAERFTRFVDEVRRYTHAEDARGLREGGHPELAQELDRSWAEHEHALERFRERREDLLGAFAPHAQWTSSATHAVLPLLASDGGIRAQVQTGIDSHRARFEWTDRALDSHDRGMAKRRWQGGFWLPECAHAPHLDGLLAEAGVRRTCVELTNRFGLVAREHLRPLLTESGVVLVPVDRATMDLVWSDGGYPAHGIYRDYHRHTIHHHQPWRNDGGAYDPAAAVALAREHARDFVAKTIERLLIANRQPAGSRQPTGSRVEAREGTGRMDSSLPGGGLAVCALDTELLGHWWYEGVHWLAAVVDECSRQGLKLVRLDEAAALADPLPVDDSTWEASTWGTDGDLSTWSGPPVAGMAFEQRAAELRVLRALEGTRDAGAPQADGAADGPNGREAEGHLLLRELLALQASDWPFMVSRGLAVPYAHARFEGHRARLEQALDGGAGADASALREIAARARQRFVLAT